MCRGLQRSQRLLTVGSRRWRHTYPSALRLLPIYYCQSAFGDHRCPSACAVAVSRRLCRPGCPSACAVAVSPGRRRYRTFIVARAQGQQFPMGSGCATFIFRCIDSQSLFTSHSDFCSATSLIATLAVLRCGLKWNAVLACLVRAPIRTREHTRTGVSRDFSARRGASDRYRQQCDA